jgi:MFS family permease
MREGLGATLTQAQWINNGYLLPLSALILLGGALGDRFGVARAFGAGIVVFVIASLLLPVAPRPRP